MGPGGALRRLDRPRAPPATSCRPVAAKRTGCAARSPGDDTGLATLDAPSEHSPSELIAALRTGQADLLKALGDLSEPAMDRLIPLPFGQLPTPVALQIVTLEYGFHHNDLRWALGEIEPLHPDIARTLLEITPGLLPMLAAGSPGVGPAGASPDQPIADPLRTPEVVTSPQLPRRMDVRNRAGRRRERLRHLRRQFRGGTVRHGAYHVRPPRPRQ